MKSILAAVALAGVATVGAAAPICESASAAAACCKVCKAGKACGDSCISRDKTCHKGKGCACDG